ncbi:MAG TPA: succinylglutamate desuccinylase/aspartoacylase family protein [Candidatus Binatia bacterium]|nr:succinylglutamate desuccinylase/aspartoacylase family protein [Candidatus Binatia bacterium]
MSDDAQLAAPFEIGKHRVDPGARARVELPVVNLYTSAPVTLPVQVVHGRGYGPVLFISAALHGDEIIGVEIIRRLLKMPALDELNGTLLAVPIVNTLAFLHQSRYLPDRRDLNRSFPGSLSGSLAARLASLFLREIVDRSDYGIDLHTGAIHRPNLPQIRGDLGNAETLRLARAFGVPLLLNSEPTAGTLREYTTQKNVPVILYESAEALRFDEICIRIGVQGVLNVLYELGMLARPKNALKPPADIVIARSGTWARTPSSGVLRSQVALGDVVRKGQTIGVIGDPLSDNEMPVTSPCDGVVIGKLNLPLVYEGDALFHIARVDEPDAVSRALARLHERIGAPRYASPGEPPIV